MTVTLINDFVLLSHAADWRQLPECKRIWESSTIEGLTGAEVRQAMRDVARRQLTYAITAASLPERVRLEARLDAAKLSGLACAPLWGRGCVLADPANAGDNSITLASTGWTWQTGDYVILLAGDLTFDVQEVGVVAMGGLGLALGGVLTYNWPAGTSCWPLLFGTLTADKAGALTGRESAYAKITIAELTSARAEQLGITPTRPLGVGQAAVGSTLTVG
jgi:hypothetical protein